MTSTGGMSAGTRERLEQELETLRQQRESLAPRLGEDPLGDSADQADLLERAESVSKLDRRIAEITDLLHGGPSAEQDQNLLPSGTRVTLKFADGDVEDMVIVAFAAEADDEFSSVTADSPLGRAIAGHGKGDTITYRTPAGQVTAEIVSLTEPA
ncbi:nucleoside diphosphate kinase regulator [Saccharomonospora sp. CUA-673]|uniref:GreA/GreB family elongation factor n=1 Tax=Saccharomonospora sp. CUA-673 TaxID=1904969 RepID=UPI00095FAC96|nr:GreA/GreB family elongation factor [Saccharomonospora sp. CUA-673]OLT44586.1 nucleoside diphosphate kinase regulator [Saccharomonospora sp. CUA-673]